MKEENEKYDDDNDDEEFVFHPVYTVTSWSRMVIDYDDQCLQGA